MAYVDHNDSMRGRGPRQDLPPAPANEKTRSRTLRPQRRSFDNISDISNQPDVGSGSDIGGRGRTAPTQGAEAGTSQPSAMRRPTVFYPAARLAPSRQTYTVRKRSQSQGMSTDNLFDHRHRSPRNPESDSEYSSSELSTSTQATTVASDDETLSRGTGSGTNKASHRPSLSQTLRQPAPRSNQFNISVPETPPSSATTQEDPRYNSPQESRRSSSPSLLSHLSTIRQAQETPQGNPLGSGMLNLSPHGLHKTFQLRLSLRDQTDNQTPPGSTGARRVKHRHSDSPFPSLFQPKSAGRAPRTSSLTKSSNSRKRPRRSTISRPSPAKN